MTINTIVTDMDDTLFNEDGDISQFTLDVMRECGEKGIWLIPASGRAQASMEPFMRRLDTGLPYIACNGAQLVNADHTMMETLVLKADLAREVLDFLEENGCYVQVYYDECFYYAEECKPSRDYKKSSGMKGVAVGCLRDYVVRDTPKLLAVDDPEKITRLYPLAKERFGDRVCFTISKPFFLEAVPPEATKGDALRRLAERMDIRPERTVVFGDSLNDLTMLAYTENSVAMGNARDEVKAAAHYVCLPNGQDGVARFVKEQVLPFAVERSGKP